MNKLYLAISLCLFCLAQLDTTTAATSFNAKSVVKGNAVRVANAYTQRTEAINQRIGDTIGKTCTESLGKKIETTLETDFGSDDEFKAEKDAKRAEILAKITAGLQAHMARTITKFNGCIDKANKAFEDAYYKSLPAGSEVFTSPPPSGPAFERNVTTCLRFYEADVKSVFNGCIKEQIRSQGTKKHKKKSSRR